MAMRYLFVGILLIISFAHANDRSPAVEDFVGIELEHEAIPHNNDTLVNLEKDIKHIQATRNDGQLKSNSESLGLNLGTSLGLLFILTLPLLSWVFVVRHLKQKAKIENLSNVKVLENYKKVREEMKKRNENKKAS
ncbi:MAG: hypothetical protein AB7I27_09625 [Bacteriovoracaceae bacterium]